MSGLGDPAQSLGEAIKGMMEERPRSCEFYHSWEYDDNRRKHSELLNRIFKKIGKKLKKRIFKDYLDMEMLEGEFHGCLQDSSYRLGFHDALFLAREMDQAGKGQLTIFK